MSYVSGKYGIIMGGKVSATRYIHATIIGNMSEVKTTISAGVDGDLFAKLTKCEQDMSAVNGELAKDHKCTGSDTDSYGKVR